MLFFVHVFAYYLFENSTVNKRSRVFNITPDWIKTKATSVEGYFIRYLYKQHFCCYSVWNLGSTVCNALV